MLSLTCPFCPLLYFEAFSHADAQSISTCDSSSRDLSVLLLMDMWFACIFFFYGEYHYKQHSCESLLVHMCKSQIVSHSDYDISNSHQHWMIIPFPLIPGIGRILNICSSGESEKYVVILICISLIINSWRQFYICVERLCFIFCEIFDLVLFIWAGGGCLSSFYWYERIFVLWILVFLVLLFPCLHLLCGFW